MEQYIEFAGNHPFLLFSFAAVFGLLVWNIFGEKLQGFESIDPQQAIMMINHDDALVVDVREDNEFKEGHIANAMHIPLGMLSDKISRLEKHRDKTIIMSCRSGNRSGVACGKLKKEGFEKIYNLRGGVIAWQGANLPLTKGKN